ncbi:MAG TPA: hypothetical protein VEY92_12460, partial [Pseudoxanthomonas sp.]|nr:hypothetical protein [Pseudoxanthomonas sp.]
AESKVKMDKLVADLRVAMRKRIEGLAWMSAPTKVQALEKLENFGLKIGHPEKWRDYAALEVRNGDLFGNAQRARSNGTTAASVSASRSMNWSGA